MKELVSGYAVTTKNKENCVSEIFNWIANEEKSKYFVCANPYSIESAKKDSSFDKAMKEADLVVPDGMGVVWVSKFIKERVTGYDIFGGLSCALNEEKPKAKYFFLGSTEETLQKIKKKMQLDFPNIDVVGLYSPPFKKTFSTEDNELMIREINKVKPDVLWVGMTAPKQEKWICENRDKLDVKFIGAIGAVFDFYIGKIKRSPLFFQKCGLEWLPRLVQEPKRLWRRNVISLIFVLKQFLR